MGWPMHVNPAEGKRRQEDQDFQDRHLYSEFKSLPSYVRIFLKKQRINSGQCAHGGDDGRLYPTPHICHSSHEPSCNLTKCSCGPMELLTPFGLLGKELAPVLQLV